MKSARFTVPVLAALVAACGSGDEPSAAAPAERVRGAAPVERTSAPSDATTTPATVKRTGRTVKVVRSQFGSILGDGRGQAFYLFDKEKTRRSECYGACAKAWPPVLTKGRPIAGKGARARLIGTTRRRDGRRQVTYRGRPLYYYVHDAPGRVLCHDVREFGGLWLVLRASGKAVS